MLSEASVASLSSGGFAIGKRGGGSRRGVRVATPVDARTGLIKSQATVGCKSALPRGDPVDLFGFRHVEAQLCHHLHQPVVHPLFGQFWFIVFVQAEAEKVRSRRTGPVDSLNT